MATEVIRKPTIYVVVNKSLGMSPPKLAAQVGHAVAQVMAPHGYDWTYHPHRWMIVLEAQNGEHLYHIAEYLFERDVHVERVIDEGVNEIPAMSLTAIGIGVIDKDSEAAGYLSGLKKYDYEIKYPSSEYTRVWNAAVEYMRSKPWYKRLSNDG